MQPTPSTYLPSNTPLLVSLPGCGGGGNKGVRRERHLSTDIRLLYAPVPSEEKTMNVLPSVDRALIEPGKMVSA